MHKTLNLQNNVFIKIKKKNQCNNLDPAIENIYIWKIKITNVIKQLKSHEGERFLILNFTAVNTKIFYWLN